MNPRTVQSVKPGEKLVLRGTHVIEGNVGKGAQISLIDGDLTIKGPIEANVTINIVNNPLSTTPKKTQTFTSKGDKYHFLGLGEELDERKVLVEGDIAENVQITCDYAVSLKVESKTVGDGTLLKTQNGEIETGSISANESPIEIATLSGNIICDNVGKNVIINSTSGTIHCKDVASGARIETTSGNIQVDDIAAGSYIKSTSGSIHCHHAARGARIDTISGSISCQTAEENAETRMSTTSGVVSVGGKVVKKPQTRSRGFIVGSVRSEYSNRDGNVDITYYEDNGCCCVIS